jgi:hypothetical protein
MRGPKAAKQGSTQDKYLVLRVPEAALDNLSEIGIELVNEF